MCKIDEQSALERPFTDADSSSQVFSQIVYLIQDKVHVLCAGLWADDDHPEKVDLVSVRLVADHHTAILHHALFNHRGHLQDEGGDAVMTDSTDNSLT